MIIENKEGSAEDVIMLAAEKLFLEKGFALTSTADIARESGCNSALIHYYFRTKERLFLSIFEKKASLFISNFFAMPLGDYTFWEMIEAAIAAHFEFIRANKRLPFLLINEITTNSKRAEELQKNIGERVKSLVDVVQKDIDKQVAKGVIRKISAIDLMITIGTLNVSTFLILPAMRMIEGFDEDAFIEHRKKEILHTVISSLKCETNE